jgi:hypothetical protein
MSVPPQLILAVVIASIYAALYNLLRNGTLRDLLFCLVAAWVGFGLGQIGGLLLGMNWLMVGSLYLLEGTILSWLMLLLMSWLRMPKTESA